MKSPTSIASVLLAWMIGLMAPTAPLFSRIAEGADTLPARQMESLGRGVVAINQGDGNVYVGWRLLGTDPEDIAFNLYRTTGDAPPIKLNTEPVAKSTNFMDAGVNLG